MTDPTAHFVLSDHLWGIVQDDSAGILGSIPWEDCVTLAKALTALGYDRPVEGTITIPTPHVTYGPKDVPAHIADADFLRGAAINIEYQQALRNGFAGSGVTETVVQLLRDSADALSPRDAAGGSQ